VQDQIRKREIRKMLAQHPSGWRFDSVPTERLNRFELDLRQAIGSVRSIGATPALMTHGNRFMGSTHSDGASLRAWEKFYPRASGETIVAFDSAARLRTLAVARDSGIVLVDLAPVLAAARAPVFADFSHFNNFGASTTADVASRSILAGVACPDLALTSKQ
jgi:hypothetical protein